MAGRGDIQQLFGRAPRPQTKAKPKVNAKATTSRAAALACKGTLGAGLQHNRLDCGWMVKKMPVAVQPLHVALPLFPQYRTLCHAL